MKRHFKKKTIFDSFTPDSCFKKCSGVIETISENSMLESRSTMVEIGVRPGESALGRAPEKKHSVQC